MIEKRCRAEKQNALNSVAYAFTSVRELLVYSKIAGPCIVIDAEAFLQT